MNTNMTGLRCLSKNLCVLVPHTNVASAWEGLMTHFGTSASSKYFSRARHFFIDSQGIAHEILTPQQNIIDL